MSPGASVKLSSCAFADRLRRVGLRPTRHRIGLCTLLFAGPARHVSAETLHTEALTAGLKISLATVYNTLHQFVAAGLLRQVHVASGCMFFDTNTHFHHHFYDEAQGTLIDIPAQGVAVCGLPPPPRGRKLVQIEVVARLRPE